VKKSIGPAIRPEKKLIETAIRPPKKYRKNADGIGGLTAEKIPKKRRPDRRSTVEKIQEKMPTEPAIRPPKNHLEATGNVKKSSGHFDKEKGTVKKSSGHFDKERANVKKSRGHL
jgi:hypothetical protein